MAEFTTFGSNVASTGGGVWVKAGIRPVMSIAATGWKGVAVGVASAGTVTRYRVVGTLVGVDASGWFPQAETMMISRQEKFLILERMENCVIITQSK